MQGIRADVFAQDIDDKHTEIVTVRWASLSLVYSPLVAIKVDVFLVHRKILIKIQNIKYIALLLVTTYCSWAMSKVIYRNPFLDRQCILSMCKVFVQA